jgi:hypothetical protein
VTLLVSLTTDLPALPGPALAEFAKRVKEQVIESRKSPGDAVDYRAIRTFAITFCEKYKIAIEFSKQAPKGAETEYTLMVECITKVLSARPNLIQEEILAEVNEILLNYDSTLGQSFGLARLNVEERSKIHEHITRIRSILEESQLTDRKKNALFDRLNELMREVDAHGTRTDRFFAFAGDAAFVLGDMAKKAKPFLDEVRAMLRIISRSRARQEGISLPPGDEVLKLPAPEQEG